MEHKRFTDFLVEKGVISNDIVLELFIEQYRKIPSTIQIILNKRLLPIYKTYKVFEKLEDYGLDFQKTAEVLNLWNADIQSEVEKERKKYKLPLGQVLVKKNLASTKQMVDLLEEFNYLNDPNWDSHAAVKSKEEETYKFEIEFPAIDEDSLLDYLSSVDSEVRNQIEVKIIAWEKLYGVKEKEKEFDDNINFVYREFHTIKGSSRFIRAELIIKIVHHLEDLLAIFKNEYKKFEKSTIENIANHCLLVLDVVWDILNCLSINKSEEPYWESSENQKKIIALMKDIEKTKKELT